MPVFASHSNIFADMFSSSEMRSLFDDEAMLQLYLDVEVALAQVQGDLGIIPMEAAEAIATHASVEKIDMDRLAQRTLIVGYPILPLIEQLSEWVPDGLGQWCHYGATTQDIMDTADVLQLRRALDLVEADLDTLIAATGQLARDHVETPMAGRTHLQQALPITFGYKAATWHAMMKRHKARLYELRPRLEVVSFAGAVGTLASLGSDKGLATQKALAKKLNLQLPDITWHSTRDNFCEVTGLLALVSASIGKIGLDIALMMQTEVGEVFEPFMPGRGGSSTMPQKRNPIGSELMIASGKLVREQHSAMLDAMVQDHERATGQWHVEWQALSSAFVFASGGLKAAIEVLEGLEVKPDTMRQNLDLTNGLIMAEAVMMGLAPKLGRQVAHDEVYDCCRRVNTEGIEFLAALCDNEVISNVAEPDEIAALLDPINYVGAAPEMVRRLLDA